jgi:16S rRNA (guanine1207-N2)-methyltransferase
MTKNSIVSTPYGLETVFQTELKGRLIYYVSKPGLPNWNQISPSMELIAENVFIPPDARILYIGSRHGAGAVALARQARHKELWLYETNHIALPMAKRTFDLNLVGNVTICDEIDLPETQKQSFDVVIIDLPKGRLLAQNWLLKADEALKVGGHLYLAGSNNYGIQTVIKDAESLLGASGILGYKKGNRIVRFLKNSIPQNQPIWASQPGIAPRTWYAMDVIIKDHPLKIFSLPGVFSYDRLDPGTVLLLDVSVIQAGSHILDLGCGYGIIGLIASRSGAAQVDFVDVDFSAIAASRKNVMVNRIQGAHVIPSDVLQSVSDRQYDQILTNPPFHSGKSVDYQMAQAFIDQSYQHLKPGGQLILVANQFIRYENLMKSLFRRTDVLVETSGYRVWQAIK